MSLADHLEEAHAKVWGETSSTMKNVISQGVEVLSQKASTDSTLLQPHLPFPEFNLLNQLGIAKDESSFRNGRYTLVSFYFKEFDPRVFPTTNMLLEALGTIKAHDCDLVLISSVVPDFKIAFDLKSEYDCEILSDYRGVLGRKARTIYPVDKELSEFGDLSFGRLIENYFSPLKNEAFFPATFLLDLDGKVIFSHYDWEHNSSLDLSEVLERLGEDGEAELVPVPIENKK